MFSVQFWIQLHLEVAKLHSASPREITSHFFVKLYPNYTQKHVTRKMVPITGRRGHSSYFRSFQ